MPQLEDTEISFGVRRIGNWCVLQEEVRDWWAMFHAYCIEYLA